MRTGSAGSRCQRVDSPVVVAVGEETIATAVDEVSHRMEPQRQAALLVEVCPTEVVVKPPEVSTTMVKPTVVNVIRATSGCHDCGLVHGPRQCPAYNRNCNKCHALGHFAKCCQNKTVHYA